MYPILSGEKYTFFAPVLFNFVAERTTRLIGCPWELGNPEHVPIGVQGLVEVRQARIPGQESSRVSGHGSSRGGLRLVRTLRRRGRGLRRVFDDNARVDGCGDATRDGSRGLVLPRGVRPRVHGPCVALWAKRTTRFETFWGG